jgi:precorrin-2/cobalt-factor-2 C20-methyltransferase
MTGTLYGIGVGPGDSDLITLKAALLLQQAPVLAWPAPLEGEGMARSIAAQFLREGKTEIPIRMSFSPGREDSDAAYDAAAEAIAGHLEAGRDVAVLCEGDPLFFGSFAFLLERLRRFPVTVVPGVASPMAAAALVAQPLCSLDEGLAVVPATLPEERIEALLAAADGAVIMKLGRHLPKVAKILEKLGLAAKARVVERVGLDGQRVLSLAEAQASGVAYFSLILVRR